MKTGERGLKLIKEKEGLVLTAYPDPASELGKALQAKNLRITSYKQIEGWEKMNAAPWTIGYGSTGPDIKEGLVITQEQAEERLKKHVYQFESSINQNLRVPVNQNQFDALVSLCYNCGIAPMKGTLGKKLNAKDYMGAADCFLDWNKAGRPLAVMPGLAKRRQQERDLFLMVDEVVPQQSAPIIKPIEQPLKSEPLVTPAKKSFLPEGPTADAIRKMLSGVESKILKK